MMMLLVKVMLMMWIGRLEMLLMLERRVEVVTTGRRRRVLERMQLLVVVGGISTLQQIIGRRCRRVGRGELILSQMVAVQRVG